MTAPRPTGSIDIWNFVDNVTGTTVRKWLRDSWARRKIVALQQAVANIVVPTKTSQLQNDSGFITQADVPPGSTASSTTPLMDGTAAVGTENAFARGDHRHPSDTNKADKATTLAGYGITNAYTKTEVDGMIPIVPTKTSDLTNDSDFQTGTQVGNAISAEAGLMVPYGYCTTGASTVAKTVTVSPAVTELTTGLTIAVKFQYANTGSNPTLNVNGLGAKAIKRYGTTAPGTSAAANWNANSVVILTYDGTYWMLVDWNNTTYSGMTDAEYQAGTGTSNRLITPARLKAAILLHAPVQSVNGATGDVTVTVPTKTSELTNDSGFITSAPVTSVNTKTGAVTLNASDVGALPSSTVIPTKTSDLTNDSGYITSAPVQSVNGQTGAVNLDASDVGALPASTAIPTKTSDLTNDSGFLTSVPGVPVYYGTCDTAANVAAKVVDCQDFVLKAGAIVAIYFANAQTYAVTSSSPCTINVNGTGAYPMMRTSGRATPQYVPQYFFPGGVILEFIFDGSGWVALEGRQAGTTYYGLVKLTTSLTSTSTLLALTASAGKSLQDQINALSNRVTALGG